MKRADGATDANGGRQRAAIADAVAHTGLTLEELWTRYFALGGDLDLVDVDAFLAGLVALPRLECDVLAHAVNERLEEVIEARRVPYSCAVRQRRPQHGALAALGRLLDGSSRCTPARLPVVVAQAARALDVELAVHLADREQRRLTLLGEPGPGGTLDMDGTLPGRAYRLQRILSSDGDRPRLWVPLVDGDDRVGVLEVAPAPGAELHDPDLREQCWWVARLVGHLVAALGRYGDELERARRSRPRTPSAELLWQQLPPLTASSESVVLAGAVEPGEHAGGDAFDYALSPDSVSLAILDAAGEGMAAGLAAAAALAAHRAGRRDGRGLVDQARAMDDVVHDCFPRGASVTGVLAELDMRSGRLCYVCAGHPAPLLIRYGKVVTSLDGGRRRPFGAGTTGTVLGEQTLQPGDWLVLHTDGVPEARDAAGTRFGEDRLVESLTRSAAETLPPPESARRVTEAVLAHRGGPLPDDASILLACWQESPSTMAG